MKILSIECSTETASASITEDRELIALYTKNAGKKHSEILLPMAEELLKSCGYTVSDIDAFACTVGPGSFTGIRIGAATIKGLAFSSNKKCVGISSLEALAYGFDRFYEGFIAAPIIDCRRGNVYNALFSLGKSNPPSRICDDRMISVKQLADELAQNEKKVFLCVDGTAAFEKIISDDPDKYRNILLAPQSLICPSAYAVALCAYDRILEGSAVSDTELNPVYLRPSQAERELRGEKD